MKYLQDNIETMKSQFDICDKSAYTEIGLNFAIEILSDRLDELKAEKKIIEAKEEEYNRLIIELYAKRNDLRKDK